MKSLRYLLLLLLPNLSFSQDLAPELPIWFRQVRFGLQFNSQYSIPIGEGSSSEEYTDIVSMNTDPQLSQSIFAFLDIRPYPTLMIKTGINIGYRSLNTSIREAYTFDFGGSMESSFQYRSKFTTFRIPFLLYSSRDWNKAKFYGGGGLVIYGKLDQEAEVRQLDGTTGTFFFRDEDGNNGTINLLLSGGYIIRKNRFIELYVEPNIEFTINEFRFGRWKQRSLFLGLSVGANWQTKS